jgi:hypothetical protein
MPPAHAVVRCLRFGALAIALHGALLCLVTAVNSFFPDLFPGDTPDWIGMVMFWALAAPAGMLARPFRPMLWELGLINAPGWFSWPKPLGMVLVYAIWIAALLALAAVVQRYYERKKRGTAHAFRR